MGCDGYHGELPGVAKWKVAAHYRAVEATDRISARKRPQRFISDGRFVWGGFFSRLSFGFVYNVILVQVMAFLIRMCVF